MSSSSLSLTSFGLARGSLRVMNSDSRRTRALCSDGLLASATGEKATHGRHTGLQRVEDERGLRLLGHGNL